MSSYKYKPRSYDDCSPCTESKEEKEYPSMHIDVGPEQLKGLEVGSDVEIVIRGKIKSLRYDTEDNWGTGASVGVSLRSSEVNDSEAESIIEGMLGED